MLRAKRRRLVVEVIVCPGAEGGGPSDGHRNKCLLMEVCTPSQSVTKSRLPKRKAWDGSKMGGTHVPTGGSARNSNEPKRVISLEPAMATVVEKWAIR